MLAGNLSQFISFPEIQELIDKYIRDESISNLHFGKGIVPVPSCGQYAFEGTCMDYCLRLLMSIKFSEQIIPCNPEWIAEISLQFLQGEDRIKWSKYIDIAKVCIEEMKINNEIDYEKIAIISQYLSNIDNIYRNGTNNIYFVHNDDITYQMIKLMEIIDWDKYTKIADGKTIFLNPKFTVNQMKADSDLIVNNTLIEIKTTKYPNITKDYLRQLAGYYCIISQQGVNRHKIQIENIAVNFTRHGIIESFHKDEIFRDLDDLSFKLYHRMNNKALSYTRLHGM